MLPISRRSLLPLSTILAWGLAVGASFFVLRSVVYVLFHKPATLAGIAEVVRFGRLTSVQATRPLSETKSDLHKMARKFAREGLLGRAAELYRHLLRYTPDSYDYNVEFGEIFLKKGDMGTAERHFKLALLVKPQDFFAHVFVARTKFARGEPKAAMAWADKAHALMTQPVETYELSQLYRALGQHYLGQRRFDDAIELYSMADKNGKNAEIQFQLAKCYLSKGGGYGRFRWFQDKEAMKRCREHLDRCLRLNPAHERARRLRAGI